MKYLKSYDCIVTLICMGISVYVSNLFWYQVSQKNKAQKELLRKTLEAEISKSMVSAGSKAKIIIDRITEAQLTSNEEQTLMKIGIVNGEKALADALFVGVYAIKARLRTIREKLGVEKTMQLVEYAQQLRIMRGVK